VQLEVKDRVIHGSRLRENRKPSKAKENSVGEGTLGRAVHLRCEFA
jgi:hypothetical protein